VKKGKSLFLLILILVAGMLFVHVNTVLAQEVPTVRLDDTPGLVAITTAQPVVTAIAQPPFAGDEGDTFLGMLEDAIKKSPQASVKVEELFADEPDMADLYVRTVLQEGLPEGLDDPELGPALTSDQVTEIIQEEIGLRVPGRLELGDGTVVNLAPGAAVWKWGGQGRWCRGPHVFRITNRALVNQWIRASMNKTNIAWKVFKPGIYTTDCMYLNVHSNGRVRVQLKNGGPLIGENGEIPSKFALTGYVSTFAGNGYSDRVFRGDNLDDILSSLDTGASVETDGWIDDPDTPGYVDVDYHKLFKLWNSIYVNSNVRPGLYRNNESATITLTGNLDNIVL